MDRDHLACRYCAMDLGYQQRAEMVKDVFIVSLGHPELHHKWLAVRLRSLDEAMWAEN